MQPARRRALGIVVALALLAWVTSVLFRAPGVRPHEPSSAAQAGDLEAAIATRVLDSHVQSREREALSEGAPGSSSSSAVEARESERPLSADSHWLLRVLRDDGSPAVGLEVRNGRPVSDLGTHAEPWFHDERFSWAFSEDPPAALTVHTDATGLARIPFLSTDEPLRCAWIRTADGTWSRTARASTIAEDGEEDVLVFGTAQLSGTAYKHDGSLRASWPILARQQPLGDELPLWLGTVTDERGAYSLGQLAAGGRRVLVQPWTSELEAVSLSLSPGELRALDFGSPRGWMNLTGQLLWPSGSPLDLPVRIHFSGSAQRVEHVGSGGMFALSVPPGVYRVHLGSPVGALLAEQLVEEPMHVQWRVPNAALSGRVRYTGSKHARASGPEDEAVIQLSRAGEAASGALYPPLRGGGRYGFCGLAPGSYELSCELWPLSLSADGRVRFDVTAADTELVLDLELHDR
jgi:hypothetical protein